MKNIKSEIARLEDEFKHQQDEIMNAKKVLNSTSSDEQRKEIEAYIELKEEALKKLGRQLGKLRKMQRFEEEAEKDRESLVENFNEQIKE